AWQARPLEAIYPLVFFDAFRVKIHDEGLVRNKAVHIALGVRAKRAVGLQENDLLVQQVTLDQRRPEPRLQPIALQFFTAAGPARQGSLAASEEGVVPVGQRRRRDTELARNCLQVFAAQQPQHRRALALSRHPATAAERRYARLLWSLRVARPPSNDVHLMLHGTPLVRKSSAYEVSQSTVMRGTLTIALPPHRHASNSGQL